MSRDDPRGSEPKAGHCIHLFTRQVAERARSAAGGEHRKPPVRCSVKFDAGLILAAVMIVAYCMTSSARSSTDCGMVRPRAFAVFMLITSSNLVGRSTGSSAGLAPLRILST